MARPSRTPIDTSLSAARAIRDQNTLIERYNRSTSVRYVRAYVFESLEQVREISAKWLQNYNEERPMTRWQVCRLLCIGPNLKPEIPH